jgi:hypothetical protein
MRKFQGLSRSEQYRRHKKAKALGVGVDEVPDTRGHHENHVKGSRTARWNNGRIFSSHGYVKIRVGKSHPLADPNGYAYEHLVVWVSAGNTLPKKGELLHHEDEDGANNRIENLKLKSKSKHGADHISQRVRDDLGRLTPKRAAGRLLDGRTWDELPEPKQ